MWRTNRKRGEESRESSTAVENQTCLAFTRTPPVLCTYIHMKLYTSTYSYEYHYTEHEHKVFQRTLYLPRTVVGTASKCAVYGYVAKSHSSIYLCPVDVDVDVRMVVRVVFRG